MLVFDRLRRVVVACGGLVVGASLVYGLYLAGDSFARVLGLGSFVTEKLDTIPHVVMQEKVSDNISADFFYRPLEHGVPDIPKNGKAVYADLNSMTLALYEQGEKKAEFPIASKGRPGSYWETPTGEYRALTKEQNHFSSIGEVWMPYSIGFFGNFFIHGWPTYPSGAAVSRGYSGGCIRLETAHAAQVYAFVDKETPIFVTEKHVPEAGNLGYLALNYTRPPAISAQGFIVTDLDNGYVFTEKDRSKPRSIASITKLMTAIISLEAVNQEREVEFSKQDVDIYGNSGSFIQGEILRAKDLLAPLLLSSSNDTAYALARTIGTDRFVGLMNDKARALGLSGTHYSDPSGLQLENVSTPEDLAKLMKYIRDVREPVLTMSRTRQVRFKTNKGAHTWFNYNWKSDDPEFLGGKVGYTDAARKTLVSAFRLPLSEFTTRDIALVVLGSSDQSGDTKKLVHWVRENFVYGHVPDSPLAIPPRPAAEIPNEEYSMLFVGDLMFNRGVEAVIEKQGKSDFTFPLRGIVSTLSEADVTFGNLEGPISDKGEKRGSEYSFRMNPDTVKALYDAGFDVVSFANNHVGDYGREALEDTFRRLQGAGILYAGAGWNAGEAHEPQILERNGIKIGFLAFSDVGPKWMEAGEALSGISLANVETVKETVRQAKDKADILVVSFHFGEEYEIHSRSRQQDLAHAAIDAGAKIVIGHHPHVAQEIEQYGNGVIAYSLGNFVFDQAFSPETKEALMLRVIMKGADIKEIEPIAVEFNSLFQPRIKK